MRYYLWNIGGPYTDAWWARNLSMKIITAGFENLPGDRGEAILKNLQQKDWIIAYASRRGAIGVGRVGRSDSYRLVQDNELPDGLESSNRHVRSVRWIHFVPTLGDAIPFVRLRLANRRTQTKTKLSDRNARRIIQLLAFKSNLPATPLSDEDADRIGPAYLPTKGDRRRLIERQIRERRGQHDFRQLLLDRFSHQCVVSGCQLLAVLEAAHIRAYRGEEDNHPENGLLLRTDIHTLFDLDLLGIHPDSLRVELHPRIANDEVYGKLAGRILQCSTMHQPSPKALKLRYKDFLNQKAWHGH